MKNIKHDGTIVTNFQSMISKTVVHVLLLQKPLLLGTKLYKITEI
jgi:hypothetical protein